MKALPIISLVVGIIAIIGALFCAYLLFMVGDTIALINSADPSSIPPGTDLAGIQENVRMLGTIMVFGWIWVISVLASGAFAVLNGIYAIRSRK